MLVRKILETVLTAGNTSVSFTDSDIPFSLIRTYCSDDDIYPISQTLTGNVLTLNYEAQSSDKYIAVEIVKQGLDIVDDLLSTDADKALSANQGKVLKDLIDGIVIPTVPENITDLDDVSVSDILQNQVLAWDAVSEKFVNVNQSGGGGGGDNYSDEEIVVGTITLNGVTRNVYRKMVAFGAFPNNTTKTVAHNITNLDMVLRIDSIGNGNFYFPGFYSNNVAYTISISVNSTHISVKTYADFTWQGIPYIILTYCKTQD